MSLANTEQEILDELKGLSEETTEEKQDSEEFLEEIESENKEDSDEDDTNSEDNNEDIEDSEEGEEEEEELEIEEEEELTGAKFRHKLKAEKEAREKIQQEAQELRERLARLEGRAEAAPKSEELKEEIPDKEYDPEAYAIYQNDKLEKKIEKMEAQQKRSDAVRQWEKMQKDYARRNPTYNEAKDFLIKAEKAKIQSQYPASSEDEIDTFLEEQEYVMAGNAANAGVLPTEHIEFLAYKAGYRPSAEKPKEIKKKPNIKNIKKNAKKNASLIGGSSEGNSSDHKTAEQLVNMGMEEIYKMGGPTKYAAAIEKIQSRI